MKALAVCLAALLACSCRQIGSDSPVVSSFEAVRHDRVLQIMREATIRDLETNAYWLKSAEREELRRLKGDFYAEVRDRNAHPTLVIPGRGWEIRGPLTIAQIEQESLEYLQKSPRNDVPLVPFGFLDKEWTELKNKYQDGDEFYFYRSDQRSWRDLCGVQGYALIRGNEEIGGIVTLMN